MAIKWPTKFLSPSRLHLDHKNPRLGRELSVGAPREIIQFLFEHYKAGEIAESIATRGFFPNEPLLAVSEENRYIVVEGNRRLAALKALRDPGLLEGTYMRQAERCVRKMPDPGLIATVPVTIAPHRRDTDRQMAGKHVASPVLPWVAENRASFILDKLAEGYDNDSLRDELGFKLADIQAARQTRSVAEMARSLDLPEEVQAKIESPNASILSTVERVFDSKVGRKYLMVTPDPEHGVRGETTKKEFLKGFAKLVTDIALKSVDSRSLNKSENIEAYFKGWDQSDLPAKKRGSFVPADIITNPSIPSKPTSSPKPASNLPKPESMTVIPKDLKIRHGSDRLKDIRLELTKLKRENFPNAGAVLLRVFFELSVLDFLERRGELRPLIERLEKKRKGKLPFDTPSMKEMTPEITKIAKETLKSSEAKMVEKAIKYDLAAPFSISDMHGFVHSSDFPGARDILQFWKRTEPLFRLMLEQDLEEDSE